MNHSPKKKRGISLSLSKRVSSHYCSPSLHQSQVQAFQNDDKILNSQRRKSVIDSPRVLGSSTPRIIFTYKSNRPDHILQASQFFQINHQKNKSNIRLQYPFSQNKNPEKVTFTIDARKNAQQVSDHLLSKGKQQVTAQSHKIAYKDETVINKVKLFEQPTTSTLLLQQKPFLQNWQVKYAALSYGQIINLRKQRLEIRRDVVNFSSKNKVASESKILKQAAKDASQTIKIQPSSNSIGNSSKRQTKVKQNVSQKRNENNLLEMEKKLKEILQICDQNLK